MAELSTEQVQLFQQRLEQRSRELREEIRQDLLKYDNEQYIDLAGRVHDSEEESVADLLVDLNLADIDRDLQELRAVGAALLRIEQGVYGECIDCGNPIALKRLEVNPAAERCIECQAAYEQRYAQPGRPSL